MTAAEKEIARREGEDGDGRGGRSGRFYDALFGADEEEEARRAQRGRMRGGALDDADRDDGVTLEGVTPDQIVDEEQLFETEEEVNLEAFDVPLREWIAQE